MSTPGLVEPAETTASGPSRSGPSEPGDELLTPTVRAGLRRSLFWVLGVTVVLGVGLLLMVLERAGQGPTDVLDPDSATPQGARALVQVLRSQGVDVQVTSSLADTTDAVAGRDATVLLRDDAALLEPEQRERLLGLGARLVVVNPGMGETEILAPVAAPAGLLVASETTLTAECTQPAAARAGTVRVDGQGLRILDPASGAVGCFPGDDPDAFALVETTTNGVPVALLGTEELLRNDRITQAGNAALALGLLGERELLVWYEPGPDDLRDAGAAPTLQELTGPWVTPLALLVVLLVVAAGFWQGRRFGPLVVERLPVEVRARETMEGRARLYARGDARGHALDALRRGTTGRLVDRLGLPRGTGSAELVAALAALTGRDRASLERLLVHASPATDAELLAASDELRRLEDEVAEKTGLPSGLPPRPDQKEDE